MGTCKWVLLILGLVTKSDGYMGAVMGKLTTCDDAKVLFCLVWKRIAFLDQFGSRLEPEGFFGFYLPKSGVLSD